MTPEPSPSPTQLIIPSPGAVTWDIVAQWVAIGILIACTVAVIFFVFNYLPKVKKIKPFYASIAAVAVLGGVFAFLLPVAFNSGFGKDDDGRVLRQLILYTTGGVLGVITLGETHRKNNQEKEKNENDHTRQVYAERRSRYTTAVEQLANEKAAVRLGGIYTLVGLVDEWLTDDTLNPKERQKEGQVIINNLCSYIRSPFPLAEEIEEYEARKELEKLQKTESEKLREAESSRLQVLLKRFEDSGEYEKSKDITADYAKFHEEQDVRRTIFVEMSKRSRDIIKEKGMAIDAVQRIWSNFDFDFSRAPIFYPLSSLTIEKGNFSSAKFYSNADFNGTAFTQTADFSEATFTQTANFGGATFTQTANFSEATFTQNADFIGATFTQTANFSEATFTQNAHFIRATFTQNAHFSRATFTQNADFSWVIFTQNAHFIRATFTQTADFSEATFTQNAYFRGATFEKYSPLFVTTDDESGKTYRARFAVLSDNQGEHEFTVRKGSKLIELGKATLRGKPFIIPVGAVLFDWDDEIQDYITSEPAEPLDNSSAGEENTTD
ncbi:pentapeptide repeat-containing protein [Rothia mucilaginosa]|uniref:pentapeptide repeat-containing protein n=1 Tax=Rothia mucilaginosa TaxID=43675 RepID=UPI0028D7C0D7|nr:pentapeptide repeat-containing protein [Rothia mucilaginosa]